MSNKQSSIDWIYNNLKSHFEHDGDLLEAVKMSFEQAKARHKQEIFQAYINAIKEYMINSLGDTLYYEYDGMIDAEEYYNKKFGDNNTGENNGEITTVNNNIPDTNPNEGNTSTTGNISDNIWGGDTSSTTGNINTWTETRTEDYNRVAVEKQIWDKTVNWDIMNKYTGVAEFIALKNKDLRVSSEEQAPYNVKTNVVTSGKTDDGTLAVIEITIDIKQR